jgi:hypothetical protein
MEIAMTDRLQPPNREYQPSELERGFDAAVYPHIENYQALSLEELESLADDIACLHVDLTRILNAVLERVAELGGEV